MRPINTCSEFKFYKYKNIKTDLESTEWAKLASYEPLTINLLTIYFLYFFIIVFFNLKIKIFEKFYFFGLFFSLNFLYFSVITKEFNLIK